MSWEFDELGHAGSEHLDADYVAAFDEKAATDWSDEIATLLRRGIGSSSTVVDLGAGTGTFAQAIAGHVRRVIAVDVSPVMIAAAHARGVEAVQAGFLHYGHEGGAADAVFSCNALHHLPDFWKAAALVRIARMLRRDGVLRLLDLVYSFQPSEADRAITAWLTRAPRDPQQGWTASELARVIRTEYVTFTWLLEPILEHAGFEIVERWVSDDQIFAAYTCLRS